MTNKGDKECISARNVLWYLVFFGFAINYMVRTNMNIAIVAMVRHRPSTSTTTFVTSECIADGRADNDTGDVSGDMDDNATTPTPSPSPDDSNTFDWDAHEQGQILGGFFWLHWLTQIPGGILAKRYGTKLVFGLANFTAALLCFLIPTAAFLDHNLLVLIRVVQGVVSGFAWPSMHNMTAQWIPPNERGKFVSAYLGSSVGAALTFPLCGYIISAWGWEPVFYVTGSLAVVWCVGWYALVYDTPEKHPRIMRRERDYIIESLGDTVSKGEKKLPTPWRSIFTSTPIWMNILAQWGGVWGLFTLMTHAPTYFKQVHGLDIRSTGVLSGLPHLLRMIFSYVFSVFSDYLLKAEKMSRTNVRKLAAAVCTLGQAACMILLALSGCNHIAAIIFLTAATTSHGAVSSGPLPSLVDISPNFAGVTFGLCNMFAACTGFLTPVIVGALTLHEHTVNRWRWVFYIAAGWLVLSGVAYTLFSTSEIAAWNSPKGDDGGGDEEEMKTLKPIKEKDERENEKADDSDVIKK